MLRGARQKNPKTCLCVCLYVRAKEMNQIWKKRKRRKMSTATPTSSACQAPTTTTTKRNKLQMISGNWVRVFMYHIVWCLMFSIDLLALRHCRQISYKCLQMILPMIAHTRNTLICNCLTLRCSTIEVYQRSNAAMMNGRFELPFKPGLFAANKQ